MKRAAQVQQSSLEAILESAVDAIITIDDSATIERVNFAAERLFQYDRDEFIGRNVNFLMPEPYRSEHDEYVRHYRKTGVRRIIGLGREVVGLRKDGSTFPMHLSVGEYEVDGKSHFTGIVHDLSERKEAERTLQQAQKMDAVGQLTGGIAHDFNNLLTVIIGNLELLELQLDNKALLELLEEAMGAAELGASLTDRLLAFARRSPLEIETVDLNSQVLGLTELLHRTLGEHISLSNALSPDLWPVRTDAGQIETAVINLAVNARDAMEDGGRLIVETRNTVIDEDYAITEIGLESGEYVQVTVSDTGAGMPQEVVERVFEPFFTTKEVGRGTGLGLAMVYGFAKQSGGHVSIYSELGKGTTVNLYLPRADKDSTVQTETKNAVSTAQGAGELVLVVEDDDRVRRLTTARLSELGYSVIEASSGLEALEALQKEDDIALVFTDIIMPGGMSGYDLCEELRKSKPDMKVLLTSGYAEDIIHEGRLNAEGLKMLRKPYRFAELAAMVRETLEAS